MKHTHYQITNILANIAKKEDGLNQILKLSLEAIIKAERVVHNETLKDMSNGFRSRKVLGIGKELVLEVPRSRFHAFYPVLLPKS